MAQAAQRFKAHSTNAAAANALTHWFREHALESGPRTYILVRGEEIASFFAIQSGAVALRRGEAHRAGAEDPDRVPVLHVAYLARAAGERFRGAGYEALLYAAMLAKRIDQVASVAALVVDPYDQATEQMWRNTFGFWSTRERCPNGCRRLYIPLQRTGA